MFPCLLAPPDGTSPQRAARLCASATVPRTRVRQSPPAPSLRRGLPLHSAAHGAQPARGGMGRRAVHVTGAHSAALAAQPRSAVRGPRPRAPVRVRSAVRVINIRDQSTLAHT